MKPRNSFQNPEIQSEIRNPCEIQWISKSRFEISYAETCCGGPLGCGLPSGSTNSPSPQSVVVTRKGYYLQLGMLVVGPGDNYNENGVKSIVNVGQLHGLLHVQQLHAAL